uniref:Uncharacterized protein n=1 Tax=Ditylenchus dipsaci TaxID=166011 RepID=A0A915DJK9_9BILA
MKFHKTKNSGILVGFKSEKKDEDLTSDKSSASLVPKIFKAIDRETGEECVCKIVTGESLLLEEEVVRAAVSEKNGFLVELVILSNQQ